MELDPSESGQYRELGGNIERSSTINNPLNVGLGGRIAIRDQDLGGVEFAVEGILSTTLTYAGVTYILVDYELKGLAFDPKSSLVDQDGTIRLRLRTIPSQASEFEAVALQLVSTKDRSDKIMSELGASSHKIKVRGDDGHDFGSFERIDGVGDAYHARRAVERLGGASGSYPISYWDYTQRVSEKGQIYDLYAIFELDQEIQKFGIYIGWDIDKRTIEVIAKG